MTVTQACTCANRREANKALTGENSVFTRRCKISERGGAPQGGSRYKVQNDPSAAAATLRAAVTDVDVDLSGACKAGSDQPLNNMVVVNSSKQGVHSLAITENNLKSSSEGIMNKNVSLINSPRICFGRVMLLHLWPGM